MVASYETRQTTDKDNEIETVGHSLYILLHQLSKRNPEIKELMTDESSLTPDESQEFDYSSRLHLGYGSVLGESTFSGD